MRQWKTISSSDHIIDSRKREDVLNQIFELAKAYTPEWNPDTQNPDMGSVIALLFSEQMEENIRLYNMFPERDYIELVNMLGLSLKPAHPAHSMVLMNMIQNTVPGLKISKGTKLLATTDETDQLIFETAHNVYVTESKLVSAFMVSGNDGKVVPVYGKFKPVNYIEDDYENTEISVEEDDDEEEKEFPKFPLFDFSKQGYGKNGALFYHTHLFDVENNDIYFQIKDSDTLADDIIEQKYKIYYYTEDGFELIENIKKYNDDTLVFQKDKECKKIKEKNIDYSVLLLEPVKPVEKNITVSDIKFSSEGKPELMRQVWNGNTELDNFEFLPFGDTISLFTELYLGHEYFTKSGANIKISFELDFGAHLVSVPKAEEDAELKVIKRKPKKDIQGAPAEIYADDISFEYFNGTGWRKLKTQTPVYQLFRNNKQGEYSIEFECPSDWKNLEIGGVDSCCIRIQVLKADNCYYMPSIHHYPIIRNMQVSYSYRLFEKPQKLISFQGSKKCDVTINMNEDPVFPLFVKSTYNNTALYLGFNKKLEDGPISIMFNIDETEAYQNGKMAYSYSTRQGFSRLKLTDHTDGLSHTGTIIFIPPSDMAKQTLEGHEAYWIQITDEKDVFKNSVISNPVINDIGTNAIEVDNITTLEESEYYIDIYEANMSFAINARNILSVDVWVNETNSFSGNEIKRMLLEMPEETKAEYNFLGEIEEFYVKWQEVSNFDLSKPNDRHFIIDRMNNMIHFGDGVNVQIPKNTNGIAFKIVTKCCDGAVANVGKNQISGAFGNMMFIDSITNSIQAFGGMDMETMDEALQRGTTLLNGRKRLVSAMDYEREVLNFSHRISQVKTVIGQKKNGEYDPQVITIVVLMDDYKEGQQSFINIRRQLKEHLMSRCELSVDPTKLEIVEPVFAEVSVEAWIKVLNIDDTFEVQNTLIEALNNYLDPIKNECWEIGRLVNKKQIELKLNIEKKNALIQKTQITVSYKDLSGKHENDLNEFSNNPYVLVTSGKHKIHFQ